MKRPLFQPDSLQNIYANGKAVGYKFTIYHNNYRNRALSCFEKFVLKVDGKRVDDCMIHFCVNGKKLLPTELPMLMCEYWGIRTPATIEVDQLGGLEYGQHEIDLVMMTKSGYIEAPLCVVDAENEPHMYFTSNAGGKETLWLFG